MLGGISKSLSRLHSVCNMLEENECGMFEMKCNPDFIEMYHIILTWIFTYHEKSCEKALVAFGAIESVINRCGNIKLTHEVGQTVTWESKNETIYAMIAVKHFLTNWVEYKTEITQIVFVEENNANDDSSIICTFESDRQLKYYAKYYAYKRGVPLRSLRFSHAGETLLLSSAGLISPKAFGMRDNDVIMVHGENKHRERSSSVINNENTVSSSSRKTCHTKAKTNNQAKKKSKVKKNPNQNEEPVVTSENNKAKHFKILSKLHEEMQPRLREIRMTLNTLGLERQSPKSRNKKNKKVTKEDTNHLIVAETGVGGKAGKPYFVVQVGEEQYLYKSNKSSARTSQNSPHGPRSVSTLDLHGCTREEAVIKLNESLKVWVETAMKGSYPFVITAEIVCGCGSQVLSETVQTWIKSTKQVRNAPKNA